MIERIIERMRKQADVLEEYAEQEGYSGRAPASVFHWQATHFRDLIEELEEEIKYI